MRLFIILVFILFSIIIFRFDSWNDYIINLDELFWLNQLQSAFYNPLPYKGFDPTTSGPLAVYILFPLKLLVTSPSIIDIRLYGLIYIFLISSIVLYFNNNINDLIFKLFLLGSFFLIYEPDFFSYNTEWSFIPIFLIFQNFQEKDIEYSKFGYKIVPIIILIICLPFIKFQSIIISCFFLIITYLKVKSNKQLLYFYLFYLFFFIFIIIILIQYFIGIKLFYLNYIERNLFYAKFYNSSKSWENYSLKYIFITFIYKLTKYYFIYFLLLIFSFFSLRKKINIKKNIYDFKFELLFLFIGIITVFLPKNNFPHYFQFLFIPMYSLILKIYTKKPNLRFCFILFLALIYLQPLHKAIDISFYKLSGKKYENQLKKSNKFWVEDNNKYFELNNIIKNETNFIFLGPPEEIFLNYRFKDKLNSKGHCFNTFFLDFFSKYNKYSESTRLKLYFNERSNFYNRLKEKPSLIIDLSNTLVNLNDKKIIFFIEKYYERIQHKDFCYFKLLNFP